MSADATLLAIDPGFTESGWVITNDANDVLRNGVVPNDQLLAMIQSAPAASIAIEMVASYGMPVGREVFETVLWIGRFVQAWPEPADVRLVYRRDVKLHLCADSRAKDSNIRQALLDLYPRSGGGKTPQVGTKSQPGPLYGMSTHAWPALAVAITTRHQMAAVPMNP